FCTGHFSHFCHWVRRRRPRHAHCLTAVVAGAEHLLFGCRFGSRAEGALYLMLFGGPLLWATLSLLVVLSGRGRRPRLTQAPMLLHYASALALVAMTVGWFDVPAALMRAQELVVIWATI